MNANQAREHGHAVVTSKSRYTQGTSTNFRVNLRNSQFIHSNCTSLLLVDAIVTNLFDNVYRGRKVFAFNDGTSDVVITMPDGHYSMEEWFTELQLQIVASGTTVTLDSYSINPQTYQLTLTFSAPVTYIPSTSDSYRITGAHPSDTLPTSTTLTFPGAVSFQGPQTVLITTDVSAPNAVFTVGSDNSYHGMLLDLFSLADTCYGKTKHHHIHTQHTRMIHFPRPIFLGDVGFILRDVEGFELSLPENSEVTLHLLFGLTHDTHS